MWARSTEKGDFAMYEAHKNVHINPTHESPPRGGNEPIPSTFALGNAEAGRTSRSLKIKLYIHRSWPFYPGGR